MTSIETPPTAVAPAVPGRSPARVHRRWSPEPRWFAIAVAAPFAVAALIELFRSRQWVGDFAALEVVVRRMPGALPLSGAYSADRGYHHPLPWLYALEWLPYRLSGQRPSALSAVALAANGGLLAWLALRLGRAASRGLAGVAIVAVLVMAARVEGPVLSLPWNPYLATVAAFAFVLLAWRIALGDTSLLPIAAGLAVWAIGCHLGFLPLVVAVAVAMVAVRRSGHDGGTSRSSVRRDVARSIAVVVIASTPIAVDVAINGTDANPFRIADHTAGAEGERVAPSQVVKVVLAELSVVPAWATTAPPYDVFLYAPPYRVPWVAGAAVAALAAARRRRARPEVVLITVAGAALAGAGAGLLLVDDDMLLPWYVLPAHVGGAAVLAATAWSLVATAQSHLAARRATRNLPAAAGIAAPVALVSLVAVAATAVWAAVESRPPGYLDRMATTSARVADDVRAAFGTDTPLLVDGPLEIDGYYSAGITLGLLRAGYDVSVPPSDTFIYSDALPADTDGRVVLTITIDERDGAPPAAGARRIAGVTIPADVAFAGRRLSVWASDPPI